MFFILTKFFLEILPRKLKQDEAISANSSEMMWLKPPLVNDFTVVEDEDFFEQMALHAVELGFLSDN